VGAGATRRRRRRLTRLLTRTLPLVLVAAAAFGYGIYEAGASGRHARQLVRSYVTAWVHNDFRAMYRLLEPSSRRHLTEPQFAAEYAAAAMTATLKSLGTIHIGSPSGGVVKVRMRVRTRIFASFDQLLTVPVDGGSGVIFSGRLLFPGLRPGEQLTRQTYLAARGSILADDRTPLAAGPQRTSPIPAVAGEIAGTLGSIPTGDADAYEEAGYPPDAQVGQDGLELIFQRRLAGQIGGRLLAGHRVLASGRARPGRTVRTTIDPTIEQAAITALGGSYAGMTVMNPRTGAVLALAGIAFSAVQPPGSTFKIITATAALQAGIATLGTEYPVESSADVDGYTMQNAGGEECGGTLLNAFAVSCDTVFAPLGVEIGAQRLVGMAQRFGFDRSSGIAGALESTIPSVATIGDGVAVGSSAIGQGEVQASTLEMADVGATIADGGRRPIPTLVFGARPRFASVTTSRVAGEVQQMMEAVVEYGTGTAAQISGVMVAGKTGTAELANTANQQNDKSETDAWFVGYAPAGAARVVACALFPSAGYGAQTAAPAVAQVLEATLATTY
jgi:peptidoglycan glycosyltransferase